MKNFKPLYLLLGLVLLSLILSACGATPTDNVLAPIQYDTVSVPKIDYAKEIPSGDTTNKLYPSLKLGEDEIAVCKLPGNEPMYVIVKTEGPNPYPSKYCRALSGKQQIYVTMHDVKTECLNGVESALCRDEIGRLPLLDNGTATANVKINFFHVISEDTERMIYELGYENMMYEFNRIIKDGIRKFVNDKNISLAEFDRYQLSSDIQKYVMDGTIFDDASDSPYKSAIKKAFRIVSFEITYLEPDGLNNEQAAQLNQDNQGASAIATQWALACSAYPEGSSERLVCECNYTCAKSGQSCSCSAGINPNQDLPVMTVTPTETPAP